MSSSTSRGQGPGFAAWEMPNFGDSAGAEADAVDLEKLKQQAYSEGFELGRRDGIESARRDTAEEVKRFVDVADSLSFAVTDIDTEISADLANLAARIAEVIIRRELSLTADAVFNLVDRVVQSLPENEGRVVVSLCPEDASALNDHVQAVQKQGWELREEVGMKRGDCRVEGSDSFVHATLTEQIENVLESMTEN